MRPQKAEAPFMLEINEIFGPTIQGEGKRVGNPSVFIRFGKCNMSCPGFGVEYETPSGIKKFSCDSFHAVDTSFKSQWLKFDSFEDIVKEVNKILPKYSCDIVITGGEPLIYWRDEQFQKLLEYYHLQGFHLTIETNATIDIEFTKPFQKEILFSMSVKLSNSGEPLKKRLNTKAIKNIIDSTKQSYLKFVIDKDFLTQAKEEIDKILQNLPQTEVYVMPLGDSAREINTNAEAVIDMAVKNGYKYSDRLHIRVWNNKRGV